MTWMIIKDRRRRLKKIDVVKMLRRQIYSVESDAVFWLWTRREESKIKIQRGFILETFKLRQS